MRRPTLQETIAIPQPQSTSEANRPAARLIAFYLPQFHPTPENNRWWGNGFTEWTNVTRARPLFKGHVQPRIPADLGFYDLRLPETRLAQAELAKDHGIEGFCYWHYWFHGTRLLNQPFEEMLASGEPELPFCLAWANESWTRTWLGRGEVLQEQTYSPEDDRKHAEYLLKAFADDRYMKVGGRPLFLIYRPLDLPEPQRTTDTIRIECAVNGLPDPYLVGINAFCSTTDCREHGFDTTLDFEPQLGNLPGYSVDGSSLSRLRRNLRLGVASPSLKVYDYVEARSLMARRRKKFEFPYIPSIFVSWDSTPRRAERGIIMLNATAESFEAGLAELVNDAATKPWEEALVFINAWNEWAEGNHLEPDLTDGSARLEAARRLVKPSPITKALGASSGPSFGDDGNAS
jgi:hypothetical protein